LVVAQALVVLQHYNKKAANMIHAHWFWRSTVGCWQFRLEFDLVGNWSGVRSQLLLLILLRAPMASAPPSPFLNRLGFGCWTVRRIIGGLRTRLCLLWDFIPPADVSPFSLHALIYISLEVLDWLCEEEKSRH
jgi:hypothetical protein